MTESRTQKDFEDITGLTPEAAASCFKKFGGYAPALASFAQSFSRIPKTMFIDPNVSNAEKINNELRLIYRRARSIRDETKSSDSEIWKKFYEHNSPASKTTLPPSSTNPAKGNAFGVFGNSMPPSATPFKAPVSAFASAPSTTPNKAPAAFGFGQTLQTTATTTQPAVSFGFGLTTPNPNPSASPAAGFSFGTPQQSAPAAAEQSDQSVQKPVAKYCSPKHFTGRFFDMAHFWDAEVIGRAPLLNLDCGFLEKNKDKIDARIKKWTVGLDFYIGTPIQYVAMDNKDEYYARVIIKDAERTFFHEEHREKFYMFLYAMYFEFGAYGQAMSYLAGLCLLTLTEQETAAVLRKVSKSYIPGHWAGEAVGFATSAWVVEYFFHKHFPDVAEHLIKMNVWPDTYLQKILSGLCVHVLKFADLFEFLDQFIANGFPYLLKFCLAMLEHFRQHLLGVTAPEKVNEIYEIMRLDSRAVDGSDIKKILQRAPNFPVHEEVSNLDVIRMQVYDKKVAPRLSRAPKCDTFEPCEICDKNRPVWFSDDLGAVCEECKQKNPKETFVPF